MALVNDYQVVVEGLASMLAPFCERVRIVELAVHEPSRARVDVALYDTFAAERAFSAAVNARHLVLWTMRTDPDYTTAALACGARGVLSKRMCPEELVEALGRVCDGEVVVGEGGSVASRGVWPGRSDRLSEREAEVLALICQGLSNVEIGARLFLSLNTIKSYIRTAYRKMGVNSRSTAILWGLDHGFTHRRCATHLDLPGTRLRRASS